MRLKVPAKKHRRSKKKNKTHSVQTHNGYEAYKQSIYEKQNEKKLISRKSTQKQTVQTLYNNSSVTRSHSVDAEGASSLY